MGQRYPLTGAGGCACDAGGLEGEDDGDEEVEE